MADDDEVLLEREDSAWDALKQRFVQAAARGAYIDVESGDVLSSRDAEISAASEAAISSAINSAIPAAMTGSERPIAPIPFAPIPSAVHAIATELRAAREQLVALRNTLVTNFASLARLGKRETQSALSALKLTLVQVKGVNARISTVQTLVNDNLTLVRADAALLRQIKILNMVATKANILIHDVNRKAPAAAAAAAAAAASSAGASSAGGGTRSRPASTGAAGPGALKRQRVDDRGCAANPIVI